MAKAECRRKGKKCQNEKMIFISLPLLPLRLAFFKKKFTKKCFRVAVQTSNGAFFLLQRPIARPWHEKWEDRVLLLKKSQSGNEPLLDRAERKHKNNKKNSKGERCDRNSFYFFYAFCALLYSLVLCTLKLASLLTLEKASKIPTKKKKDSESRCPARHCGDQVSCFSRAKAHSDWNWIDKRKSLIT